jgi:hypothetical protein
MPKCDPEDVTGRTCKCEKCVVVVPKVEELLVAMRKVSDVAHENDRTLLYIAIATCAEVVEAVLTDTQDGLRSAYSFIGGLSNEIQAHLIREIVGDTVLSLSRASAVRVSPEALTAILTKVAARGPDGEGNGHADA